MSFEWTECPIPGLHLSRNTIHSDFRGYFSKVTAQLPPDQDPLRIDEIYWSESHESVVRGLHFQLPPFHGRKIVFVTQGQVRDFVLDMRVGSPTFHKHHEVLLSRDSGALLIPAGCAHGFEVLSGPAIVNYAQEGFYNKDFDSGILVNSTSISIQTLDPEFSERDLQLPALSEFTSPFIFAGEMNAY